MIYTAINGNSYDSATGKLVATGVGQNQTSITNQVSVSSLRSQMANGTITPAQALAQLTAGAGPMTEANQNALAAAKTQLFQPMTINKGGQIMNLNNDGSVTVQSTTVNNSTTTNTGTTTSTQNQTPGEATTQTVKSGDTLSQIAASNGMTLSALEALNPQITNPNLIHPGDSINLSSVGTTAGNTSTLPIGTVLTNANGQTATVNATTTPQQIQDALASGWTAPTTPTTAPTTPTTPTNSSGPNITPTGNSALDAGVTGAINYVTGSLASGYTINPSLTANNIASMLPQFIQETTSQLEPQLQQNLQQTFTQAGQSIQSLAASYTATQTADVQAYQKSLSQIMQGAPSPGQTQAMQYLTTGTNQSLAALDASAAQQIGSTAQNAGAQLGTGGAALQSGLSANGIAGMSGLNGYSASDLTLPTLNSQTVGMGGALGSLYAGSPVAGNALNFQYNPSIYTSGSIPQAFSTAFSQGLNTNIGNYELGSANAPTLKSLYNS